MVNWLKLMEPTSRLLPEDISKKEVLADWRPNNR
jgi:hypothetical protein